MKLKLYLLAGCLMAPLSLFAQNAAEPPKAAPGAATKADVDPAVIDTMRKSFAAQRAKGSFRARIESTGLGAAVPAVDMEFVFPDRMRMKMSGVEVVGVGEKTMVKMGEGWNPAPSSLKSAGSDFGDPKKVEEMLATAVAAKSLGPAKVDGIPVDSYQLNTKNKEGISRSKIYIIPATGLIQRIETEAEMGGQKATSRMDYFDYGAPIKIELPKQ